MYQQEKPRPDGYQEKARPFHGIRVDGKKVECDYDWIEIKLNF